MPIPNLHILRPHEGRWPGMDACLAQLSLWMKQDAYWDKCRVRSSLYDLQGGFNVPTVSGDIRANLGPVIVVEPVQLRLRQRLQEIVGRDCSFYPIRVTCGEILCQLCQLVRHEYEGGEPRILRREALAYLIVRKLQRLDKWGGESLNKNFLWKADLPRGGFPKEILDHREIYAVADTLVRQGILTTKDSKTSLKYALGDKREVQPILDNKSFTQFTGFIELRKFFERSTDRVSVRILNYEDPP